MKLALAGCAHIHTPAYLRWLAAHPDVTLVAVAGRNAVTAGTIASRANTRAVAIEAVWTLPGLDAVLILSETIHHPAYVEHATAHGLHVFLEKPLATTGDDAVRIAGLIEAAGVISHIGFFLREHPGIARARRVLQSGVLGQVTRARVSVAHDGALQGWFKTYPWMLDAADAGFGGFGDMAVHGVDLLLWFFGTEIDAVTASVGPVDEAPGATDHFGEGMIRFRNGPLATVVSSWVDAANPLTLEIVGTRGIVQVRGNDVHAFGFDLEKEDPVLPVDPGAALGRFVDAVRSGNVNGPGIVPPRVAALSTQVVDACYRGARENRWVMID